MIDYEQRGSFLKKMHNLRVMPTVRKSPVGAERACRPCTRVCVTRPAAHDVHDEQCSRREIRKRRGGADYWERLGMRVEALQLTNI